jgi:hypothetical protein
MKQNAFITHARKTKALLLLAFILISDQDIKEMKPC